MIKTIMICCTALSVLLIYSSRLTTADMGIDAQAGGPLNEAVLVGQNAIFECDFSFQNVAWMFMNVETGQSSIIVVACTVTAAFNATYRVNSTNGCHLIIDNVKTTLAGTYTCQDFTTTQSISAELIVIEANPSCGMNTSTNGVIAGVSVQFTCEVKFTGNIVPSMKWKDELEKVINTTATRYNSTFLQTSIVMPAGVPILRSVSCQTYFDSPTDTLPGAATNGPSYEYKWTSQLVETFYAKDCSEIKSMHPDIGNDVYYLKFTNKVELVKVYCDMETEGGGWTVFQRRIDGPEPMIFYRKWLDYNNGFGDAAVEFWLGNDYISTLSNAKWYILRVDLGDWEGQYRYARYNDFKISDADDKYRLTTLGTYSGDAGDSLTFHRGQMFSTYDQDNDALPAYNCSANSLGAWWYNNCQDSNLNGQYNSTMAGTGVNWRTWLSDEYSLRFTEMKIRPV